ncbi:MAG: ribosomal RNA small subunit methyltransferase A [Deltaproteobacteria bacterium]|nr:ribosomal RNA small subunit methyltransferase A [Deltaproteobacteria bacterium]
MFLSPQEYYRQTNLKPRKRFGQHFLSQLATAERIVASADLHPSDVAVEVGPGLGALTRFILPRVCCLHLVELDRDLAAYLQANASHRDCRVLVHSMDILQFDFQLVSASEKQRLVVLGNLPYNISSPLGFRLLECFPAVKRAVFMVQKEVGERWLAGPGGKEYGVLSVLFGIYGCVTPLFSVSPSQFYPPPKVESMVLRVDFPESAPGNAPPFPFIRRLVSAAFQQRRKTLRNSLQGFEGLEGAVLSDTLRDVGIDPGRRPETLSPSEFLIVTKKMFEERRKMPARGSACFPATPL